MNSKGKKSPAKQGSVNPNMEMCHKNALVCQVQHLSSIDLVAQKVSYARNNVRTQTPMAARGVYH